MQAVAKPGSFNGNAANASGTRGLQNSSGGAVPFQSSVAPPHRLRQRPAPSAPPDLERRHSRNPNQTQNDRECWRSKEPNLVLLDSWHILATPRNLWTTRFGVRTIARPRFGKGRNAPKPNAQAVIRAHSKLENPRRRSNKTSRARFVLPKRREIPSVLRVDATNKCC
jgi:hypothetical protein